MIVPQTGAEGLAPLLEAPFVGGVLHSVTLRSDVGLSRPHPRSLSFVGLSVTVTCGPNMGDRPGEQSTYQEENSHQTK